jgi:putative acetyltransferase
VKERAYEATDLSRVIDVYTASIRSLAAEFYSPEQIAAWSPVPADPAKWQERLSHLHTVVAEHDGALAGFVSYNDDGYLDLLFTHPDFARQGVASRLFASIEAALRSIGLARITTHASLAARAFFEGHGFEVDAEEFVDCRGVMLRRFAMHKQLHRR